jgi:hypothetical protein
MVILWNACEQVGLSGEKLDVAGREHAVALGDERKV